MSDWPQLIPNPNGKGSIEVVPAAEADRLQDANDSLRTWVEMGEAEADRLRAELEIASCSPSRDSLRAELAEARAERDRYREALEMVERTLWGLRGDGWRGAHRLARAALEGSEDG